MAAQVQFLIRTALGRAVIMFCLSVFAVTTMTASAQAIENLARYAGLVVDAKTGEVLYQEAADSKRFPASVTKVMTLYILFQELNAGNLQLSTKMTVSRHAAAAVPTKLGLKAGSTITVDDAIRSLVTISANDMARVIAEHISGTESKFAERMTATARALGMRNTHYANASGLPDSNNFTTVRDQAILGMAVYQHFPQYYEYFQVTRFRYAGRTYTSHNNVLGYMGAVDGLKTGWTSSSGSTILTAARADNRHIVVVVFGMSGARPRDQKVRELVAAYLPKARRGDYQRTAMIPFPGAQSNVQVAAAPPSQPVFVMPQPLPGFRLAELVAANSNAAAPVAQPQYAAMGIPAPMPLPTPAPEPEIAAAPAPAPMPAPIAEPQMAAMAPPAPVPAVEAATALAAPPPAPLPPSQDVIGAWLGENLSLGAPPAPLGQTRASAPL